MKVNSKIIHLLFLFTLSTSFAQSVNVGVRIESLAYLYKDVIRNTSREYLLPLPLSAYIKAGISYDKYELEMKLGGQLGEVFVGPEYAIEIKYNLIGKIFPLLVYLNHNNVGDGGNSGGPYHNTIEFLGGGVEAKLTKFFGVDLIFYFPVGKNDLEYANYVGGFTYKRVTSTKITSMVKLGFIFNFSLL